MRGELSEIFIMIIKWKRIVYRKCSATHIHKNIQPKPLEIAVHVEAEIRIWKGEECIFEEKQILLLVPNKK